jgi:hypothetical protein
MIAKKMIICLLVILLSARLIAQTSYQLKSGSLSLNVILEGKRYAGALRLPQGEDVYEIDVPVTTTSPILQIHSDLDSITMTLAADSIYLVHTKLPDRNILITIHALKAEKNASFNRQYISSYKNTYTVILPEVQELLNCLFAITPTGLKDSNVINHHGYYYEEVIDHFMGYANDPLVLKLERKLKEGSYASLKMNSNIYVFENNDITIHGPYHNLGWNGINNLKPFIPELERFAKETRFREFFRSHKNFYDSLLKLQEKTLEIRKQWKWLENKFPITHDRYVISFSPLVNGSHSAIRVEDSGFKETIMFVAGPHLFSSYEKRIQEAMLSRMAFTLMGRNYVKPVSENYIPFIDSLFGPSQEWILREVIDSYTTPSSIFNEYMTWSLFNLYAHDNYKRKDFELIKRLTERDMVQRGFIKFREFNKILLDLYIANKQKKISDLYLNLLRNLRTL